MARLEIIHLRLAAERAPGLVEEIRASVETEAGLASVTVFRHATVTHDLGIHLRFVDEAPEDQLSALGLRLASSLRELGMVEHTLWIEDVATPREEHLRK